MESVEHLGGINEVARGQAASNIHLCPCYGLDPLWLFLSVTEQTAWLSEYSGR